MFTLGTVFFTDFSLRRSLCLIAVFCLLPPGTTTLAQHHSGHSHGGGFGGGGAYNNSGSYNGSGPYGGAYIYNYGGFNANAPLGGFNANAPLGGVSLGNGFGTATYSQRNFGVTTYGLSAGGFGGVHHGIGYGSPVIWSTPIYNYSPSVFGYGTGIFSPNFPSGNYVSNGYVGFVPSGVYNPWCNAGLPYAVGMNSYFPGSGIAPTVLMLNMNLNIQPAISMQPLPQPTSSFPLMDPRIIDQLAPAVDANAVDPDGAERPPVPQPPEPGNLPELLNEPHLPARPESVPLLNEFNAAPREQGISSLAEKINSLRYQASGDDAFHKSDYATADVFYATAIKTAPDRRAPYLRMAIVRIALADFPNAVSYLKTGLTMESDPSRPWFTAEELYGQKVAERARTHGGPLWNWLAQRPMSADRLLLAGTFQKLRGYNKTADEMLAMARHEGAEATLVSEVQHLAASDIGQRSAGHDLDQLIQSAAVQNESSAASKHNSTERDTVEQVKGIFMRGSEVTTPTEELNISQHRPQPAPDVAKESQVPIEIPIPEPN